MFTIHSPVNNSTSESYLSFHFPFQIIDVWRVQCIPTALVRQKTDTWKSFVLCKYLSTYFFFTHIPTHNCKLNLYLPFPLPFQICCVLSYICVCDGFICKPTHCVIFLCKYLSTYFFLTHIPTHNCKVNLYLTLLIPFQMFL